MKVDVRHNNVDRAIKVLKRKLDDDGMFKELQAHAYYEKPGEKRRRKKRAAITRQRKATRERMELLHG